MGPGGGRAGRDLGAGEVSEARSVIARVTYLEMREHKRVHAPPPMGQGIALMQARGMPVAFYRYLYDQVGREHHWWLRKAMADAELSAIIGAESTHIHVLYADGCPAGYFELDASGLPETVELAYFGLCADYVGRGLGRWFLRCAIDAAWEHGPGRVTVHTNNFDHKAALPLYQKMGFSPIGTGEEEIRLPA